MSFKISLESVLQEGLSLDVLTQKEFDSLNAQHPIISIYHGLPKIHKGGFPPPLRPIISGIGSLCERLSEWVDVYLPTHSAFFS